MNSLVDVDCRSRVHWPSFSCIVLAIAWVYVAFGTLPEFSRILWGIKPVIIAIILQALVRFGRAALKTGFIVIVSLATLILNLMGVHELILLLVAAFVGAVSMWSRKQNRIHLLLPGMPLAASYATASFSVSGLFLFFLKVGSVLFGSGYVLIAFLRADLVERWHWLTDSQLIDAITVGQVTPGPVFTTATFIGYLLGRWNGAAAATIGIFLPAFIFVAISGPLIPRIRKSIVAGAALDCINAASLGLMCAVTWKLATSVLIEPVPVVLFLVSLAGLILFKLNSVWLILAGALVGSLSSLFNI